MHDRFEPLERLGIANELFGKPCAVDLAVNRDAGERCLDRANRLAFVEPVHYRIGIMHRHAGRAKEIRRGRLAHADRAGEAEDEHSASRLCPDVIFQNRALLGGNLRRHAEPVREAVHRLIEQHA